jgi:hypothetical protein
MRQFKFESEIYETLNCVPMVVRRKLDRIGIKIGLKQWQALGRGERLAICHMPAERADEIAALNLFIREALARHAAEPATLPESDRISAVPPADPPDTLAENARRMGFNLDRAAWSQLDDDERYALIKLGAGPKLSHNLRAALGELLEHRTN